MIGPALMRLVILHYHIFKNAGSTIEDILDHSFGERFANVDTPAGEGLISNPDLVRFFDARPGLRAFSSHQVRHPLPEAPGYLFFDICFLRDPIDRIRSIYTYFRRKPNPADPMSALANRTALGDFIAGMIQDFPLFVKNVQVNLLACAGDSDEPQPRDLDLATGRMMATSFLGVVDCFDQSVAAGAHALRCAFPELDCARPAVNVSDGLEGTVASRTEDLRRACTPEVFEELQRLNALDRQLVDRARAEVLRRFRQIPPKRTAPPVQPENRRAQQSAGFFTLARRFVKLAPYWRQLTGSALKTLFDGDYYRDSLLHFLVEGAYQGRQPHPLFDPAFYLRKYPDVAASGANPLCHYLKYGAAELRQPHPLFDPGFYLDRNPDIRRAGVNPLVHYIRHGAAEDRKPHPLFEPSHYRNSCAKPPGQKLLEHFLKSGPAAASPHTLFDCKAYLDAHPEAQDINPLVHYLLSDAAHPNASTPKSAAVAHIEIQDAQVTVVLLASNAPKERRAGVALVWPDADGLAQWFAAPQQQPFFDAVRLDQIRAQVQPASRMLR
jgi:hypothetical protein